MKMFARFLTLFFAVFAMCVGGGCATTPPRATTSVDVKIREVKPRHIEESQFVRLREFYSGREETGRRMIFRTDPTVRDGYYFVAALDKKLRRLPRGSVVRLEAFTPFSNSLVTHEFYLPRDRPNTREIFLGLTGDDWPDAAAVPAAWRVTLLNARGVEMGRYESFLWSL